MTAVGESFARWYAPVRADIFKFCEALRFEPTWQQREMLTHVQNGVRGKGPRRIGVKSGQGAGKSTASGVAGLWLAIRNVGAMIPVTAPTMKQCHGVWLTELARTLEKADPWVRRLVTLTATKVIIMDDPKWGIRFVTATKPEAAQGLHERNMSIIVDEASGVSAKLLEQWFGTMSNPGEPGNYSILLLTGNPNTRDSFFFRAFNDLRHLFAVQTINTEECPIASSENHEVLAAIYGRESDVYRVRVLGEFPHADPCSVMSSEDLFKCTKTDRVFCIRLSDAKQFGIDLARYGGDESVIYRRAGNAVREAWIRSKVDPGHVLERAMRMQYDAGWKDEECLFVPDAGGMGQGAMHRLIDAHKRVYEFHNGGVGTGEYANQITAAYFQFAKIVKRAHCHIPNDNLLIQQLSNRKYHTAKDGRLILETKDEYIKRGNASPDRADGMVMCFWDGTRMSAQIATSGQDGYPIGARRLSA